VTTPPTPTPPATVAPTTVASTTPVPVPTTEPADSLIPSAPSVGDLAERVAAPVCANDPGSWCQRFYEWTDNDFLARSADTIVDKGFTIAVILVVAVVARYLLHRAITRLIEGATSTRLSKLISRRPRPAVGERAVLPPEHSFAWQVLTAHAADVSG